LGERGAPGQTHRIVHGAAFAGFVESDESSRVDAEALSWPEIKRLMTVPGVNVIVAATFIAAVGDVGRFADRRKLTAYLGLDPRVRQSGPGPAAHGHISKQGSVGARHALVERAGRRSASRDRSPASISASRRAAGTRRDRRRSAQARPTCSGACSPAARTTPSGSRR
jgi:transposase